MSAYHKNALPPGYALAEYKIDAVLGHGGFGITYLASDTSLGAQVAIKEYLPHDIAERDEKTGMILPYPRRDAVRDYQWGLKNFVKEARALARFKHANIVRVLRFLEANGTAYTVMEYETGRTLADHLKREGPTLDEPTLLRIFIPILNGLHAVHEANMLHLDIKPANIYLRTDGSPMLIDFGSARQAITGTTQAQRMALTRGYAPMEQYPDKGKPGTFTDIYSLGASMYRCVTGRNPLESIDRYRAVLDYKVDPLTPSTKGKTGQYQSNILECIDWAMQIYPKDRPQTAREFQDALMGARGGRRAAAAEMPSKGIAERNAVYARAASQGSGRRPPWALIAAALVLIAAAVGGYFYWPEVNRWVTRGDTVKTDNRREPARAAKPALGSEQRASVDSAIEALPPAAKAATLKPGAVRNAPVPTVLRHTLSGHKDWVQSVTFTPDSRWLVTGSSDKTIKVWEVASGKLQGTLRDHGYSINGTTVSPDGRLLASAGIDGSVQLWELASGKRRLSLQGDGYPFYAVAFSPLGNYLCAAGKGRTVYIWHVANGERAHSLEGHEGDVFALAFSPDGRRLASAGADRRVIIWNLEKGDIGFMLRGHQEHVLSLAYSRDGALLVSGDAGSSIRLWDPIGGSTLRTLTSADGAVLSLVFGPDGRWFAAGIADNTVRIIDPDNGRVLETLRGHAGYVQSVALSPDGMALASGSRDHHVKLWGSAP